MNGNLQYLRAGWGLPSIRPQESFGDHTTTLDRCFIVVCQHMGTMEPERKTIFLCSQSFNRHVWKHICPLVSHLCERGFPLIMNYETSFQQMLLVKIYSHFILKNRLYLTIMYSTFLKDAGFYNAILWVDLQCN